MQHVHTYISYINMESDESESFSDESDGSDSSVHSEQLIDACVDGDLSLHDAAFEGRLDAVQHLISGGSSNYSNEIFED